MKRLFTAFPIDGEIADEFLKLSERNNQINGIRWTKKDNLHITLFFIGEIEESDIDKIKKRLSQNFSAINSFQLNFAGIEVKSKNRKPSMIWGRFEKCNEYSLLSKQIEESISEFMTVSPQHKDPIPHCTIARIRSSADLNNLELSFNYNFSVNVNHVELWMTVQSPDGVVYERIYT